jgi:OOP family OmpA-OmpF porin
MTMKKGFLIAGLLVLASGSSYAEPAKQVGVYVGANAGWTWWDDDNALPEHRGMNDTDITWQVNAGYKFNKNFAIDARYADIGRYWVFPNTDYNFRAWTVNAVGILPLSNSGWEVFGQAGAGQVREVKTFRETETAYTVGAGVRYSINRQLSLSAQTDLYTWDSNSFDNYIYTLAAGIQYIFE